MTAFFRICIMVASIGLFAGAAVAEQLVFGIGRGGALGRINFPVLEKIYAELGYEFTYQENPSRRSLAESSEGRIDGEVLRIATIGKKYPTLLRVEPPLMYLHSAAFVRKDSGITLNSPEDLANYTVSFVTGAAHSEHNASFAARQHGMDKPVQVMSMLQNGRVDVALLGGRSGQMFLMQNEGFEDIDPNFHSLRQMPMHHYIYYGRADLKDAFSARLAQLVANGELEGLQEIGLQRLLEK